MARRQADDRLRNRGRNPGALKGILFSILAVCVGAAAGCCYTQGQMKQAQLAAWKNGVYEGGCVVIVLYGLIPEYRDREECVEDLYRTERGLPTKKAPPAEPEFDL